MKRSSQAIERTQVADVVIVSDRARYAFIFLVIVVAVELELGLAIVWFVSSFPTILAR